MKKKICNPLVKRIPMELRGDWRKYLIVSLFLILVIGFVSGMYVANESMVTAANNSVSEYRLEDGHFELKEKAEEALLFAIASGEKADVKAYYTDKAGAELDEKFEDEFQKTFTEKFNAGFPGVIGGEVYREAYRKAYDEAYETAYNQAWEEILTEIDEKYAEAEEKYQLNDPDFQPVPAELYENFYRNEEEDNNQDGAADGTVRVFVKNEKINLACLMDGRFPEADDEIAIDRMHADNVGVTVGDRITVGGQSYRIVGLIAYVNYSTLHEKSTDLMFDALKFNVAMVTDGGFDRLSSSVHYAYAWQYRVEPADEKQEKSLADDFLPALLTQTVVHENDLVDFLPAYANPAIQFSTNDMGSDMAMGGVLLDILIVIIAFIFAVTVSSTITKEAKTIGTLRASGYTKGEIVGHYLAMPVIVTLISAAVGNALGYTVFKNVVVSMYYNSYSLPTYETLWNPDAFLKTTLIPVVLMFVVNLTVIAKKLQHTPLEFLRGDLKRSRRKKAVRLPRWKFFDRFRLRIILQNIPGYLILCFGVFFIMVLLAMAVGMPSTLDYYKENAGDMMFARYQYILNSWEDGDGKAILTESAGAEPFCMKSLERKSNASSEEISVYGIAGNSSYVEIEGLESLKEDEVYLSDSFGEKYGVSVGDTVVLEEKYENRQYAFKVAGFYPKSLSISVFMPIENFRTVFELEANEFSGYLSDREIEDIDEDDVASVITERDITKMCDQLDHSMGAYMEYFQVLCILLSAVMIYLLTKMMMEKNENAISMTKILGYENREIASLYLVSTAIVLLIADAAGVFLGSLVMNRVWKAMMLEYSGWFTFHIRPVGYLKMFLFVLIGYLIVACFDFRRIKKIPMEEALKNVE